MDVLSARLHLLQNIQAKRKKTGIHSGNYLGTAHTVYHVRVPDLHTIANAFHKQYKDMQMHDLIAICGALFCGTSREEKVLASMILAAFPDILKKLPAKHINRWMGTLSGWEEVGTFCRDVDVWLRDDPTNRTSLLKQWNKHKMLEKRRASLVVLCSTVRKNNHAAWATLSYIFIGTLTSARHVMITKAISWLLRSLLTHHQKGVRVYLQTHTDSLPKIALRETLKKMETGKK